MESMFSRGSLTELILAHIQTKHKPQCKDKFDYLDLQQVDSIKYAIVVALAYD